MSDLLLPKYISHLNFRNILLAVNTRNLFIIGPQTSQCSEFTLKKSCALYTGGFTFSVRLWSTRAKHIMVHLLHHKWEMKRSYTLMTTGRKDLPFGDTSLLLKELWKIFRVLCRGWEVQIFERPVTEVLKRFEPLRYLIYNRIHKTSNEDGCPRKLQTWNPQGKRILAKQKIHATITKINRRFVAKMHFVIVCRKLTRQ